MFDEDRSWAGWFAAWRGISRWQWRPISSEVYGTRDAAVTTLNALNLKEAMNNGTWKAAV